MTLTRRSLARLLAASAAAPALPAALPALAAQSGSASQPASQFPAGFLWGTATASYQVEGAVKEAGRGPSIWDTFSHTPGKTHNGDTGDVADDFFHGYRDDIRLMQSLGVKAFRFSVAWPRIFPSGSGSPNPQGLDFYKALVAELLAHGIQPFCTLYHWDLPQALQDKGGWENPDTPRHMADYAGYVAAALSAAGVQNFFTTNEIRSFTELGYGNGIHAPGLQVGRKRLAQLTHHAILGHGLSVLAIRAKARPGTRVGLAENPTATTPVTLTPADITAAHHAMREENAQYLTAILEGRYTPFYINSLGADAPRFTPEEMRAISAPLDFIGLNVYAPTYVRASAAPAGYEVLPRPKDYPHMASDWLTIGPECLYWTARLAHELWRPREIFITENGCSAEDVLTPQGEVLDTARVMYLKNYISQLGKAVAQGVPVKGYFCWSLLDNYEWADGYDKRFGIVYVDFKTGKRTPKLSAQFYQSLIASNGVNL